MLQGTLVGAFSGLVSAGVSKVVAGGSFFGQAAISSASGFWAGAVVGLAGGFTGGFTSTALNTWIDGGSFDEGLKRGLKDGAIAGLVAGVVSGIGSGLAASKRNNNFFSGKRKFEVPFDNNLASPGTEIEYSNSSAQDFVDSNPELKRLSENVDYLYADGSYPTNSRANYTSVDGQIRKLTSDGWEEVHGVTVPYRGKVSVYLSKSAFKSALQLYITMHHEYMHAFFVTGFYGFSANQQHAIINNWQRDQFQVWNNIWKNTGTPVFQLPNIKSHVNLYSLSRHYGTFGFKTISNFPQIQQQ